MFAAGADGTTSEAWFSIRIREPRQIELGGSGTTRTESASRLVRALEDWVEERPELLLLSPRRPPEDGEDDAALLAGYELVAPSDDALLAAGTPWSRPARRLDWTWEQDGERWFGRVLVLKEEDRLMTVQLATTQAWLTAHHEVLRQVGDRSWRFSEQLGSQPDADRWFAERLDWDAPWKFNIFFSVGSSLAFAGVLFLLASWRLSRIDF